MGKLAHPLPPGQKALSNVVLTLANELQAQMGINEYCYWLFNNTPVTWAIDAPESEILTGLQAKLKELTP